jgi:hypothetical protein
MNSLQNLTKASKGVTWLAVLALAVPAGAAAQTPTEDQYSGTDRGLERQIEASGSAATDKSGLGGNVGPLPFTGFDVIAMAAVALAVTGIGLALQRAVFRERSDPL